MNEKSERDEHEDGWARMGRQGWEGEREKMSVHALPGCWVEGRDG